MVEKSDQGTGEPASVDLGSFYGGGDAPGELISGDGGNGGDDSSGGSGSGDGHVNPATAFDGGSGDDGGDDYIRGDDGAILLSPTGRKRRRRGPRGASSGGGTRAKEKATKLSVGSLETLLLSTHQMGAALLEIKSLDIGKQKANLLAEGIVNVARHYPTTEIDPRVIDGINLGVALIICYKPVYDEVRENMRARAAERRGSGRTNGGSVAVADPVAGGPINVDQAQSASPFDGTVDLSKIPGSGFTDQ